MKVGSAMIAAARTGRVVLPNEVCRTVGDRGLLYVAIVTIDECVSCELYWGTPHAMVFDTCLWQGGFYTSMRMGRIYPVGYSGDHAIHGVNHAEHPALQYKCGAETITLERLLPSDWMLVVRPNSSIASLELA